MAGSGWFCNFSLSGHSAGFMAGTTCRGAAVICTVFLIFMATFFPLVLATMSAVATIPKIYFRVAQDYHYKGIELLTKVTFPAVLPQVITALRVSYGIAWVVIVAAEMVGCQDGLGYGIWEARNGLRLDSAVCYMIIIGLLGMGIDRLLAQLTKLPDVRWGYER
jgi:NitT/TauT family transport system permease protein